MNYADTLAYLTKSYAKGSKHGLSWVKKVLEQTGSPHLMPGIIHVAGTNGKGSTCAMLGSILQKCGYSVGMFTSPHLISFNERIRINNVMISDEEFSRLVTRIKDILFSLTGDPSDTLSFFEILTISALTYFHEKNVDYAIIETGIGGRLDSTNVVENPLLSIITSIGLDHMDILGDTPEKIAREKAGIIKENCKLVLYSSDDKVYNIIVSILQQKNGILYYFNDTIDCTLHEADMNGTLFSFSSGSHKYEKYKINLLGKHQVLNACHTLLAVEALRDTGVTLPEQYVRQGLAETKWPGRMDVICNSPLVVMDGAHNVDGSAAFDRCLRDYFHDREIIIVAGVLKDKEYHKIINISSKMASTVIATQPDSKKALSAYTLSESILDRDKTIIIEPDYRRAIDLAFEKAICGAMIAITGSLYLVGDIRKYLIEKGVICNDRF